MNVREAMAMMDRYFGEETKVPVRDTFSMVAWKTPRKNHYIIYNDRTMEFELVTVSMGEIAHLPLKAHYNLVLAYILQVVNYLTSQVDN